MYRQVLIVMALSVFALQAAAQSVSVDNTQQAPASYKASGRPDYSFLENADRAKYETAAIFLGISVIGAKNWNWGSSNSFKFHSEGWFGKDTGSGGTDKLGHAFSAYTISDVLTDVMVFRGSQRNDAALTAALISAGLMTYVEIFDGYSVDHGFSKEDMVMNLSGIGLSYLRNVVPGLRDKLDYRMEYWPSGHKGFKPLSDYAGQRYLLALKGSGFDALRDTPLRYFELQFGYYARGFTKAEHKERERTTYFGIGINLGELFFGRRPAPTHPYSLDYIGRAFFEHFEIPYTNYRAVEHHF